MKKLFVTVGVLVVIAVPATIGIIVINHSGQEPTPTHSAPPLPTPTHQQLTVDNLWRDVNTERATANLPALTLDAKLNASAQAKCNDEVANDYFDHVSPQGTQPWYFIQAQKEYYLKAAENLASNYDYADTAVGGWMASPGHRANILDSTFTDVGYGICQSPDHGTLIVQHFTQLAQ